MTREDVIRMAREAGFHFLIDDPVVYAAHEHLAALHSAHEREQCAKVCEELLKADDSFYEDFSRADSCAAAIRARWEE